jgi:hemerythrin
MTLIEWSDNLSVNIDEIDSQHQQLVGLINDLNDAMRERKAKEALGGILNSLTDYTIRHFSTEENYFDKFEYPETRTHKKEHTGFVEKVATFKEGFEEGKLLLSIEVMDFLKDWLISHIKDSDKKYGPFLNEKGLK